MTAIICMQCTQDQLELTNVAKLHLSNIRHAALVLSANVTCSYSLHSVGPVRRPPWCCHSQPYLAPLLMADLPIHQKKKRNWNSDHSFFLAKLMKTDWQCKLHYSSNTKYY